MEEADNCLLSESKAVIDETIICNLEADEVTVYVDEEVDAILFL